MADEKLPARTKTPGLPEAPQSGSIFGRIKSAFRARLNTRTILDNTTEAEAYRLYTEEMERLAEATLKKDRAVAHYIDHRDDLIRDDHERHLDQMENDRHERKRAAQDREHQAALLRLRQEQELNQAKRATAQSQWGLDAFIQSLPLRKERLEHLFKSGALDAQLDVATLDEKLTELLAGKRPPEGSDRKEAFKLALEFLDQQIELGHRTHAPDEAMSTLYGLRSHLNSRLEAEKNRPD